MGDCTEIKTAQKARACLKTSPRNKLHLLPEDLSTDISSLRNIAEVQNVFEQKFWR